MSGHAPDKLVIEGVSEFWFKPAQFSPTPEFVYRPAALIECSINFRSLRAGLNHSEERNYTAWLPEANLAIDWDEPAADFAEGSQLAPQPSAGLGYHSGRYVTKRADLELYQSELIEKLARTERLRIFRNPVFGLFSAPGDQLQDFLPRVAEAALGRVEPEMRRLRSRFELQLEQVREAQAAKGFRAENLDLDEFISRQIHLFESETRMAAMFSTLAGTVFGTTEPRVQSEDFKPDEAELREDLGRVEQEASDALRVLYSEYLSLANEYDVFEIGLQPDNIQVTRRALLWVPVEIH